MHILITFILFLFIFLMIIDFFTILLKLTGVEHSKAKFQVISLLTGTGFTTKESEIITQHPTRRKIAKWIMIFGYVSSVTFVSFIVNIIMLETLASIFVVCTIIIILLILSKVKKIIDIIEEKLENSIRKNKIWIKFNKTTNQIISRNKGYGIMEIYLDPTSPLVGVSILNAKLTEQHITILNIDKGDELINYPTPSYIFEGKDKITVYGNIKNIKNIFK